MEVTLPAVADLRTMPGVARLFMLLSDFDGVIDGIPFHIAAGFVTDLASIPHLAEAFIANDDPVILRGAIPHDWFYQYVGNPPGWGGAPVTRSFADAALREAMKACGATWFQRWTVWLQVRQFGFLSWHPHVAQLRACDLRAKIKQSIKIQKALKNI